jgi:nucleoside-diphosphate-sugar epimerase
VVERVEGVKNMKTAIVFGGGGFIGNHLVSSLKEEGFVVKAVDIKYPEFSQSDADIFIIGDLRDKQVVDSVLDQKFDEVYQLAADMGGIGYISKDHDASILTNSSLINLNILQRSLEIGIEGIFYSSSACIYPEYNQMDPNNIQTKENTAYPAAPDTEYGWEKLFSERLYLAYNKDYGMKNKIGRYHNVFGPLGTYDGGKEKAPAAICRKVIQAKDLIEIWGDGNQIRSFLYIDECIKFTKNFYRNKEYFDPVNIGSTKSISINDLVDMVCLIDNKKLKKVYIPGPTGVNARTSDNDLIRSVLNDSPKENLFDGLKETYMWIQQILNNSIVFD